VNLGGVLVGAILVLLWGMVLAASIYEEFKDDEAELRKDDEK
jgi:hypothetical protein